MVHLFYKDVRRHIREECVIEANSIEEATKIHNEGMANYEEVDCWFEEIMSRQRRIVY